VYALGLTLYEMVALRPAFDGKDRNQLVQQVTTDEPPRLDKLNRAIPRDLVTIVHKAIDREPAKRYQTAQEMAEDLRRFLAGEPVRVAPPGVLGRLGAWCRRPERVRDAAVITLFYGAIDTIVSSVGLGLAVGGAFPIARWLPALGFLLVAIAVGGGLLWAGRRIAARRRSGLWAGVMLPLVIPIYQCAAFSRLVDTGGLVSFQDRSMTLAQVSTIGMLSLITIGACLLGLIAHSANRHRPDFLPEDAVAAPPPEQPGEITRGQVESCLTEDFNGPA
jgi:hypothetical protein